MSQTRRSLEIAGELSSRSTLRSARELGLFRPTRPTEEGAREFRASLERLGTTFIKLGQLLASRPDLVGETYAEQLNELQDSLQPIPLADVRAIVAEALGRPLEDVFAAFEDAPLGSASIAQTHGAVRRDTGEAVVVKVLRPGIADIVEQDLQIIDGLARRIDNRFAAARLMQLRALADELGWSLRQELDMRSDCANGALLAEVLEDYEHVRVPRVHPDLTSKTLLVMERLDGERVDGPTGAAMLGAAKRGVLARELLQAFMHQVLVEGIYHADPHPGNLLIRPADEVLVLLDFGLIGRIDGNTRIEFGLVLLAMAENRAADMANLVLRMSATHRTSDAQAFEQELRRLLPRYHRSTLSQIDVGQAIIDVQKVALRCGVGLPVPFALIGKTLSQVDAIARALDPDIDPLETIRGSATAVVRAQLDGFLTPSSVVSAIAPRALSLLELPRRAERLLEALEQGTVNIDITPQLDEAVGELRTITNRLAAAGLTAAMAIASALLMNVRGVGNLLGYPALGLVGFLISALMAMVLVWRMLRTKGGL